MRWAVLVDNVTWAQILACLAPLGPDIIRGVWHMATGKRLQVLGRILRSLVKSGGENPLAALWSFISAIIQAVEDGEIEKEEVAAILKEGGELLLSIAAIIAPALAAELKERK